MNRTSLLCLLVLNVLSILVSARDISWKASGKGGAVEAGIELLEAGGNAADAAAATLLAPAVTDFEWFAVGGEIGDSVRKSLAERGHRLSTAPGPIAHPMMLVIDHATGVIHVAGDPAADRHAAALEGRRSGLLVFACSSCCWVSRPRCRPA